MARRWFVKGLTDWGLKLGLCVREQTRELIMNVDGFAKDKLNEI